MTTDPTCKPDLHVPDWTAALREAQRLVDESTVVVQPDRQAVNLARCILAAHEERERVADETGRLVAQLNTERERTRVAELRVCALEQDIRGRIIEHIDAALAQAPRPAPTETAAAESTCPPCRDGAPHQFMRDGGDCLACGWGPDAAVEPSSEPAPTWVTLTCKQGEACRGCAEPYCRARKAASPEPVPVPVVCEACEGVGSICPPVGDAYECAACAGAGQFGGMTLRLPGGTNVVGSKEQVRKLRDGLSKWLAHVDPTPARPEPAKVRDESKPAPGWAAKVGWGYVREGMVCETSQETWREYDSEHGYAPPEPPPVEWTNGRARVGDCTLERLDMEMGCIRIVHNGRRIGFVDIPSNPIEAKRLAITLAREMARCS